MSKPLPIFKPRVPEWLIRLGLLALILPGIVLFALSASNVNAAAGYYGVSPNDVQYSLIILYGAMASFIVLEGRFFKNIASKEYLLTGVILLVSTCYVCYITRSFAVVLIMRYLQGILTCGAISITLTLMFTRLHSERGKEIAYSVLYCILLSVVPLTTLITAQIVDSFNYNVIYKCAIYSYIPGTAIMFLIMNQVRLNKRVPLYRLDWGSFVLYSAALCLIGYVLVYGQQYEWLGDKRIACSLLAIIGLLLVFGIRQRHLRRPYLHLNAFKNPKFILGALLLFVFYIVRGAFGLTTTFIVTALGYDPIHIGLLLTANIAGIILSVIIASRFLLTGRSSRLIFLLGFVLLLAFHVWMSLLFTTQANAVSLIVPLVLQGMGAGMLMVPIILFLVSAAPAGSSNTGSAIGIFMRFLGFCSSIALINFCQLLGQQTHINRFQDTLSALDANAMQRLATYKAALIARGALPEQAAKAAQAVFNKNIATQAQLKFSVDYYHYISLLLVMVIVAIALFPSANDLSIKIKNEQPAPVAF